MQRSCRALLQRRADSQKKVITERRRLYNKVPQSLVLLTCVIFVSSFIGHGNAHKDDTGSKNDETYRHETLPVIDNVCSEISDITADQNIQETPVWVVEAIRQKEEVLIGENNEVRSSSSEEQADDEIIDTDTKVEKETPLKSDRLSRIAPPGLDEFKIKAVSAKEKPISSQTGAVIHRLEPGGKEYNYASSTKGAKVLEYNKEAKGASNILEKDKDKYLRNPCSAEEKYVVIELSEETLVDTIVIANFEHYSSNFKDFELLSSLVYPTDSWAKLGNFTAQNAKHAQRFSLPEPKWARYLKIILLSHYGSEFYCTLSVVEVFGVDAVERMLEDLISVESKRLEPNEHKEQMPVQEPNNSDDDLYPELLTEIDNASLLEGPKTKKDVAIKTVPDPILETRQVGRMPGDTVLKILLQKVQSLDMNFSVLERYLEELNGRYAHTFKDFDDDIQNKDILLDKIKLQIKSLQTNKDTFAKDIGELLLWKSLVSSQLDELVKDNAKLRSDLENVRDHQADTENRALVVIFISFVFGCVAAAKLFVEMLLSIFQTRPIPVKFCKDDSTAWLLMLLSTSFIAFILVL